MASPILTTFPHTKSLPDLHWFLLFPLVPKELRLQIWALSLEPRVLKLQCSVRPLDFHSLPNFLYLVGGYGPPFRHFTFDWPERPQEPYFTVTLEPYEYTPPPILEVCKESRDIAFENGYKAWEIEDEKGERKIVMWNPEIDFVLLEEEDRIANPLEIFLEQFPGQAKEVRRVAAWSSMWKWGAHADVKKLHPLAQMNRLRQFAVVIDEAFERAQVEALRPASSLLGRWRREEALWEIPRDVTMCFNKARRRYLQNNPGAEEMGVVEMRVVRNPDALLGDEDLSLKLRKWPCDILGFDSGSQSSSIVQGLVEKISRWYLHLGG
jgi:hypothetical protein